jgi:hypothetical protein
MRLRDVCKILDAEILTSDVEPGIEAQAGCGADLLSDVLTFAHSGTVLLTGLTNPQVVVTAEIVGIVALVFVRGKRPPVETVSKAEERGIPLLATRYTMFEACGRLFAAGLVGCDRRLPPQQHAASRLA